MSKFPKRGDVFWTNLDPTLGSEINKTRPTVIISNDTGNEIAHRVVVAPITSSMKRLFPFEVTINLNDKKCKILLDQLRSIDKKRLRKDKITSLDDQAMKEVDAALKIVLSLD